MGWTMAKIEDADDISAHRRTKDAAGNEIEFNDPLNRIKAQEAIEAINTRKARTSMFDKFRFVSKD